MSEPKIPNRWWSAADVMNHVEEDQAPTGDGWIDCLAKVGWAVTPKTPDNEITAHFVSTGDEEIDTMQAFTQWLNRLPSDASRLRVLRFLTERFTAEAGR